MSIKLNVEIKGDLANKLAKLGSDLNQHVLRSSARAGALVFYDRIKQNVPVKTGKMKENVYHKFVKEVETKNYKMYKVGVNQTPTGAPHLWWMEYGHMFRYAFKKSKKTGEYVTLVRPDKIGTPRPGRHASQAEKDAYYIPLKNPFMVQGTGFVRKSYDEGKPHVLNAVVKRAKERFNEVMQKKGGVKPDVD